MAALDTGYENYANIVFACDFDDASGNFTELVSSTQSGVMSGTTTSRGTDPTYGGFGYLQSDDGVINFGDNVNWDGKNNFSLILVVQNDADTIPGSNPQYLASKMGSGTDAFEKVWQNSENILAAAGGAASSITDGLDNIPTVALGTAVNVIGFTSANGGSLYARVNNTKGGAGSSGAIAATAHSLRIGNSDAQNRAWRGKIYTAVLLDIELSDSQVADIVANPRIFFASAGTEIDAGLESISISTFPARIARDSNVAAQLESLQVQTNPAVISLDQNIAANLEQIALTPLPANIVLDVIVSAQLEQMTLGTFAAAISTGASIDAQLETIELTPFSATISSDRVIAAQLEQIEVATYGAAVSLGLAISATLEQLVLSPNQATVALDVTVASQLANIILQELAAQIGLAQHIDAGLQALTITPFGATLVLDNNVVANLETLTVSTFQAVISSAVPEITAPGLEYTYHGKRLHFTLEPSRLHFTFKR